MKKYYPYVFGCARPKDPWIWMVLALFGWAAICGALLYMLEIYWLWPVILGVMGVFVINEVGQRVDIDRFNRMHGLGKYKTIGEPSWFRRLERWRDRRHETH